jgi:phospholipid transport system substrate-binding protein
MCHQPRPPRRPPETNNREWTRKTELKCKCTQMYADKNSPVQIRLNELGQLPFRARRWLLPLLLASGVIASSVIAAPADPVAQLRSEVDQVLALAYSGQSSETLAERARPLLEKDFSFDLVTRQAIGPGWRQFTPGDRQKVIELFSRLVIRIYAARVVGTQRPNITYGKTASLAPDRCEIPTRVAVPNGEPYAVVYRLINLSGGWRIYDVLIEGVSFVANYRAQFDDLVRRGGAAAVIKTLEAKLAEPINPNS